VGSAPWGWSLAALVLVLLSVIVLLPVLFVSLLPVLFVVLLVVPFVFTIPLVWRLWGSTRGHGVRSSAGGLVVWWLCCPLSSRCRQSHLDVVNPRAVVESLPQGLWRCRCRWAVQEKGGEGVPRRVVSNQWGGRIREGEEKTNHNPRCGSFHDALAGPPTSWVPSGVSPPQTPPSSENEPPTSLWKGRSGYGWDPRSVAGGVGDWAHIPPQRGASLFAFSSSCSLSSLSFAFSFSPFSLFSSSLALSSSFALSSLFVRPLFLVVHPLPRRSPSRLPGHPNFSVVFTERSFRDTPHGPPTSWVPPYVSVSPNPPSNNNKPPTSLWKGEGRLWCDLASEVS